MNDAEYVAAKERIDPLFTKWKHLLFMAPWRIDLIWYRDGPIKGHDVETGMACTDKKFRYLEAEISIYVPRCADLNDDEVQDAVVHELSHLLLAPMWVALETEDENIHRAMNEHTTSWVARSILNVYQKATQYHVDYEACVNDQATALIGGMP